VSWVGTHKIKQEVFGWGIRVIATAPLQRKEVIGVFSGHFRSFSIRGEKVNWEDADVHYILDLYRDGERLLVMELLDRECALNQINHSCRPNCELTGIHSLTLVAMRDIRAGEELTFDYRPITICPIGLVCWCPGADDGKKCQL
jgi:hypothetical protein